MAGILDVTSRDRDGRKYFWIGKAEFDKLESNLNKTTKEIQWCIDAISNINMYPKTQHPQIISAVVESLLFYKENIPQKIHSLILPISNNWGRAVGKLDNESSQKLLRSMYEILYDL